MRVLGIVSSTARRGAEVFARDLVDRLIASGHPSRLAALGRAPGAAIPVDLVGGSRWAPRLLATLVREARRADVVVGFGGSSLLTGALVARVARRPFVYRSIGDPAAWGSVRARAVRLRWPARSAAHIVALYPAAAAAWHDLHGVPPAKVTCIPNAVRGEAFAVADTDQRRAAQEGLGLDPSLRWVAFIGSLSEEKRPLDALAVVAGNPHVGLVVAGTGPLAPDVAAAAASRRGAVHVVGPLHDVRPIYAAAEAVLVTSRTEGMPAVLIEAGLSGLPVAATEVGGVAEVVVDGTTGVLFPPGDVDAGRRALEAVLDRPDMGLVAEARCRERFTLDVTTSAWLALLDAVVRS